MSDFQNRIENLSQKRLVLLALQLQSQIEEMERRRTEPIAIVGLGCRFPGAEEGPDSFWRLLERGGNAIREVPGDRWAADAYYDANIDAPGRMATKWGGFLSHIDRFDAPFFGIAGREANEMDPQHRILLEVCWEALEHSGHSPRALAGTATGVFVGICASDYQTMLLGRGEEAIDAYLASGTSPSIGAGRISYTFGLQGPSIAVDTACSASLVAVHLACQSLRTRESSMALAGGVNAILLPDTTIALSKAHMMAPDGLCKSFDARADGFVRAEGCGIVVLKRLSDAVADGDNILALIRGSALNQDGRSSGITAPNGTAQEAVIRAALTQSGVGPEEIGYVEAHGTGTSLGDPIEAHALAAVLGPGRGPENPLVVGSVKTNLGHMESTAGVAGLIKVVLGLQHQRIPAHLHFEKMNPHIDWGNVPVEIPVAGREWRRGDKRRIAGLSSFGFSGTNAHVIIEEAPAPTESKRTTERSRHLLALSARSEEALRQLGERYAKELEHTTADLGDFCYTANAGRSHFEQRLAAAGSTAEEIRKALLEALPGQNVLAREVRPVFLFPGQGAQYPGMGKELYETQPVFRAVLEECTERLRGELEKPLIDVLWGNAAEWLDQTEYTQPALFAVEYGIACLWQSWGIEPAAVLGHSVGEYVAACVAGVYSLADGLKLIAGRGRLMAGVTGNGAMAAVWAAEGPVREALRGFEERVGIAGFNAPESVVISGYGAELAGVEQRLQAQAIQVQRLKVSHGFHSPQMREMEGAFEVLAGSLEYAAPRLRMISSVTGRALDREEIARPSYWRSQVSEPVRFRQAMETLREMGSEVFLEAGPGTTLNALGRQSIGGSGQIWLASVRRSRGEWEQMLESLGQLYVRGAEVNWVGFDQPYHRRRVPLPTYSFQRQRYWFEGERRRRRMPEQAGEEAPADWYYEIAWRPRAAGTRTRRPGRRWLIVSEGSGVASEVARRIRESGDQVALAGPDEAIRARLHSEKYDLVLHLAAGDGAAALKTTQAVVTEERGTRLWLATMAGQFVGAGQAGVDLAQAPLWGIGKALAMEHPASWGGMVDLDPLAPASRNAAELVSAIENSDGEDQIAFRDGKQYVARLVRRAAPSVVPERLPADKTYLVTGGLGGLGLKVAEWMASRGARNVVLIGRKGPSEQASVAIEALRSAGVRVEVHAVDVSSMPRMETLFQTLRETMPTLGGIMHAAGVLDDGLIAQQTWERIEKVMLPKAAGAWNLHRLTADIPLDFFVMFSSVASLIGSSGQASYAAANAYLDALAWDRRAHGLPAVSINWGGWAEVGMAARVVAQGRRQSEFQLMPCDLALAALGQVLAAEGIGQIGIAAVDWPAHRTLHASRPFVSELLAEDREPAVSSGKGEHAAQRRLREFRDAPQSEREIRLVQYLIEALAPILGIDASTIDPSKPITDFGLDSLMALELRNRINSDLEVALPTVRLLRGFSLEEIAAQLKTELPQPQTPESNAAPDAPEIEFPLSFGQQSGWFGHKLMLGSGAFNVGLTAKAFPGVEWAAFERAVRLLTARHAALRTVFFETEAGVPMQRVLPSASPDIALIDATSWSDSRIQETILQDFHSPIDLGQSVFRARIFRGADGDVLFFKCDHIVIDHWSVRICIEDLKKIYTAELAGTKPDLDPLPAEYSEFVEWERKTMEGPEAERLWQYWKRKLGGELPILRLPSPRPRPAVLGAECGALPLAFSSEHWSGVQRIAREYRTTGYSVLLAVFEVLLYRYTGQNDVVVGTSVSGRENPKWTNMLGLFINVLPLRGNLSGNPTFAAFLARTRDTMLEALEYQDFPFSLLVAKLRQPRNLERIPIFQAFFNFLTDRSGTLRSLFMGVEDAVVEFGESTLRPYMVLAQEEGRPEVSVQLAEIDGKLVGYFNYNLNIVELPMAEAMAAEYISLLDTMIREPNTAIDDWPAPAEESDREKIVF